MNFIFLTQSKTLSVFFDVAQSIGETALGNKNGFYISDSPFYNKYKEDNPVISSGAYELLKEWEIIAQSRKVRPDIVKLREYEKKYGDPFLWNALVADRRIYFGKKASLEQDYASRFDHERMLAILQIGFEEMELLFDKVRPDAVVGFICVTIGEYIAYLIARARNIPFINLRPTRIKNYFYAGESVLEPSERLEASYLSMLEDGVPESLDQNVRKYLDEVRQTHAMYEGVIPAGKAGLTRAPKRKEPATRKLSRKLKILGDLAAQFWRYNFGKYRYDNSHRGVLYPQWFARIKRPARDRFVGLFMKRHYLHPDELNSIEYAFFPLHKEPEVTLLVYSRPYLNQIEVIRNLARSLPIGMKLVVKEHPGAVGYRKLSYYHKLLDIPNVVMAPPGMTSRQLIEKASLVTVITGSVGLEALMMRKPIVTLGRVSFNFLPDTMSRHVRDLDQLGWEIHDLLESHNHDEKALIAYVAAVMDSSVQVDFYSILLGRKGVYNPNDLNSDERGRRIERKKQVKLLADYLERRYEEFRSKRDVSARNEIS